MFAEAQGRALFFLYVNVFLHDLHSFPTRRSSDLSLWPPTAPSTSPPSVRSNALGKLRAPSSPDRKSTRLNSSHQIISYAVFCLKKKTEPYRALATAYQQRFAPVNHLPQLPALRLR